MLVYVVVADVNDNEPRFEENEVNVQDWTGDVKQPVLLLKVCHSFIYSFIYHFLKILYLRES